MLLLLLLYIDGCIYLKIHQGGGLIFLHLQYPTTGSKWENYAFLSVMHLEKTDTICCCFHSAATTWDSPRVGRDFASATVSCIYINTSTCSALCPSGSCTATSGQRRHLMTHLFLVEWTSSCFLLIQDIASSSVTWKGKRNYCILCCKITNPIS